MANINIKNPIVTNGISGIVTFADNIAVEYTTDTFGDYEVSKTLTQKLLEIETLISEGGASSSVMEELENVKTLISSLGANTITYSEGVTVALKIAQLETLLENTEDITSFVNRAEAAANRTEEVYSDLSEALTSVQNTQEDINKIKDIAEAFGSSFDADASFAIVTKELYDNISLDDIAPNCIYFCI